MLTSWEHRDLGIGVDPKLNNCIRRWPKQWPRKSRTWTIPPPAPSTTRTTIPTPTTPARQQRRLADGRCDPEGRSDDGAGHGDVGLPGDGRGRRGRRLGSALRGTDRGSVLGRGRLLPLAGGRRRRSSRTAQLDGCDVRRRRLLSDRTYSAAILGRRSGGHTSLRLIDRFDGGRLPPAWTGHRCPALR